MGLDIVEFIMACEEEFNIEIPDEDAGRCNRVGDLYQLILEKIGKSGSGAPLSEPCLSSVVFYRLRRSLISVLGIKRHDMHPNRLLHELLGQGEYPPLWKRIEEESRLKLPELVPPALLSVGVNGAVLLLLLVVFVAWLGSRFVLPNNVMLYQWMVSMCLGVLVLLLVRFTVVMRYRTSLPHAGYTVREWVTDTVGRNGATLQAEYLNWDGDEVWRRLCDVLQRELKIQREKIVPEARIIEDLALG